MWGLKGVQVKIGKKFLRIFLHMMEQRPVDRMGTLSKHVGLQLFLRIYDSRLYTEW